MSIRNILIGLQSQAAAASLLDYPSFVSASVFFSSSGTGLLTIGAPTYYIDGDLLILEVATNNQAINEADPTLDGWTKLSSTPIGTGTAGSLNSTRVTVFYKFASGFQGSVTVELSSGTSTMTGRMYAFRRIDTASPVQATANAFVSVANVTHNFPGVTTTSNNALITMFSGLGRDADQTINYTNAVNSNLSNLNIIASQTFANGVGGGHAMVYGVDTTAGFTGNTVITSISSTAAMVTAAFNPSTGYSNNRVFGVNGFAVATAVDATATCNVALLANGVTIVTANTTTIDTSWYGNITEGVGSSFYVRAINVASSGLGTKTGNVGVWESLSVTRRWSVNDGPVSSDQSSWDLRLDFSPNSNGNPIIATGIIYMSAAGSPSPSPTVGTVGTVGTVTPQPG